MVVVDVQIALSKTKDKVRHPPGTPLTVDDVAHVEGKVARVVPRPRIDGLNLVSAATTTTAAGASRVTARVAAAAKGGCRGSVSPACSAKGRRRGSIPPSRRCSKRRWAAAWQAAWRNES